MRRLWNQGVVTGADALALETADTVHAVRCALTTRGREEPDPSLTSPRVSARTGVEPLLAPWVRGPAAPSLLGLLYCFGLNYSYSLQRTQEIQQSVKNVKNCQVPPRNSRGNVMQRGRVSRPRPRQQDGQKDKPRCSHRHTPPAVLPFST